MKKITLFTTLLLAIFLIIAFIQERSSLSHSSLDSYLSESDISDSNVEDKDSSGKEASATQSKDSPQESLDTTPADNALPSTQDSINSTASHNYTSVTPSENSPDVTGNQENEKEIVDEESPAVSTDSIEIELNEYGLELSINGATGYASISLPLYMNSSKDSVIMTLEPGTAFQIVKEESDMWLINVGDTLG